MKRVPKSFDVSLRPDQKHLVVDIEEEDRSMDVMGDELSSNLNRLQVSSSHSQDDGATLSSSHNSHEGASNFLLAEISTTKKSKKSKRKKKLEAAELLASLISPTSLQEEEEQSFARCLDSGVRSVNPTGFFFAKEDDQSFTVFRIEVTTVAQAWVVWRRYSDFVTLAGKLQNLSPPNFPPKTPFGGNFAKEFLRKRQVQLNQWLEKALATPGVVTLPDMRDFLVNNANCPPASLAADFGVQSKSSSTSSGYSSSGSSQAVLPSQILADMKRDLDASRFESPAPSVSYSGTSPGASRANKKSPYAVTPRKVAMTDFEQLQVLGKGSFGKVVLVVKKAGRDASNLYAMKILHKENVVNKKQVEHTLTERSVLGKMNHPFIVKLHYAFQTDKKLHFVLDYCAGGELFFHLGKAGRFTEEQGRFYAAEMTLALGHLHSHGVVYRDLKPENILFEATGHLKLADFGLSKEGVESTQGSHSFCGTPEYLAPEVLNRTGHGTAVDWWSLGALLYEMLTGLPPWFSQDRQKLFLGIRNSPLRFPPEVSPLSKSVLSDFLNRDPLSRLGSGGVEDVKRHPFFHSIDWVALYELRVPPPFVPTVARPTDTANFDLQFTRMPLQSEDFHAQQKKLNHEDILFGGFTYQEESGLGFGYIDEVGIQTPPTPVLAGGFYTPPPLPQSKRSSPMRPAPNVYHSRASTSASSSLNSKNLFLQASPPPAPVVG